ncbi:MAG: histidine kinase [Bacteroidia bacterium]|nr:histidine kinase [Bacteroidia bacterium]
MKWILTIVVLFIAQVVYPQQPAYFILGENQFKGVRIFDIIQDNEDYYYFATNEGIIKYDFIQYTKIETKESRSAAFFNLVKDKNGIIYFNNLNNQIFKIEHGKSALVYTLPAQYSSNIINLKCDEKGQILISCRGIIVIDKAGKVVAEHAAIITFNSSYRLKNGKWIFPIHDSNKLLVYENNAFSEMPLQLEGVDRVPAFGMLHIFDFLNSPCAIDLKEKRYYTFDENNFKLKEVDVGSFLLASTNARPYVTGNSIWAASPIAGIHFCQNKVSGDFQVLYKDYFISDVFLDNEGNILMGTFDKGIIVIPDIAVPDVIDPFAQDPMISVYSDNKGELFMGSHKGLLKMYLNNAVKTLSNTSKKPIEGVYGDSMSDYIIYDDEQIRCYNRKTGKIFSFFDASLKDVCFINSYEIYLGTNVGVFKIDLQKGANSQRKQISGLTIRIYSMAYDKESQILYVSTANGLFQLRNEKVEKLQYLQNDIFSEKISIGKGGVYVLTRQYGLLLIDKAGNIKSFNIKTPNKEEEVKEIQFYNNTLVASTNYGLYRLDMTGNVMQQFHTEFGFSSKKIYSYSIAGNDLWVSHSGGVQKISLQTKTGKKDVIKIRLKTLLVNDSTIDYRKENQFISTQRKFTFVILSPSLRNLENIQFHYKLKGYDEKWISQKSNVIQFNALSPGQYTLLIKAENFGEFSKEISYTFVISKAFYYQWWFVLGVVLLFLLLVYLIYKRQIEKQKRKSKQINELNLSKLTAIQSQMNPHFIFNSLNSIQDLVLQQNATKAYDSIGKFALLIRKIMHHSEKEFIDIEEELSMLNVYLEMEQLRFKKDFKYQIESNQITDIEIPPMLIQPFIENALKHGLLHKEGMKELNIEMQVKGDVFECVITDNGVGRVKSKEIKERQNKLYESFSGQSLQKRLEILKKHFGGDFGVEILDLYGTDHTAIGTKVVIKAPFKRKF